MSINAAIETREASTISTGARAAANKLFGISGNSVESPSRAKAIVKIERFWSEVVPKDIDIPKDREIFLGFDYDDRSQSIVCTERTLGEEDFHEPNKNHLIMLHTEPARSEEDLTLKLGPVQLFKPSKTATFADSLPIPYFGDMHFMLKDPSVYANIIIRLGLSNDPAAMLLVLRTDISKDITKKLLKDGNKLMVLDEKRPVSQQLSDDKLVSQEGGFALYRGFVSIPPNENDVLRLRKFPRLKEK